MKDNINSQSYQSKLFKCTECHEIRKSTFDEKVTVERQRNFEEKKFKAKMWRLTLLNVSRLHIILPTGCCVLAMIIGSKRCGREYQSNSDPKFPDLNIFFNAFGPKKLQLNNRKLYVIKFWVIELSNSVLKILWTKLDKSCSILSFNCIWLKKNCS